jgi:hypothetical protein
MKATPWFKQNTKFKPMSNEARINYVARTKDGGLMISLNKQSKVLAKDCVITLSSDEARNFILQMQFAVGNSK